MDDAAAERARVGINRRGHMASFRRMTKTLPQTAAYRADVKIVAQGYKIDELTNGMTVGSRSIIVSKLDLIAAGFPVPLMKLDRIYLGENFDRWTTIQSVDEEHREYNGCYDIVTEGA
jgi:hypothetical protein